MRQGGQGEGASLASFCPGAWRGQIRTDSDAFVADGAGMCVEERRGGFVFSRRYARWSGIFGHFRANPGRFGRRRKYSRALRGGRTGARNRRQGGRVVAIVVNPHDEPPFFRDAIVADSAGMAREFWMGKLVWWGGGKMIRAVVLKKEQCRSVPLLAARVWNVGQLTVKRTTFAPICRIGGGFLRGNARATNNGRSKWCFNGLGSGLSSF